MIIMYILKVIKKENKMKLKKELADELIRITKKYYRTYKFIGTKQDLIENGFLIKTYSKKCRKEIAGTWYALRDTGVYCEVQKENETIIVFQNSKEISFNGGWMKLYIEDYIQDLIDKGLVVEND